MDLPTSCQAGASGGNTGALVTGVAGFIEAKVTFNNWEKESKKMLTLYKNVLELI